MSGLLLLCTKWTLFCSKSPENCIYLNQSELSNFFMYLIRAEIIRLISKSNERAARVWFEVTSMISEKNYMTRGSITTLLHPFWNHPNTGLGKFKYFIDAAMSWSEIKFIHFLGGKSKSFGNKSCKICHMILFVFHFPAIWLVILDKPWNRIACFVFSVACALAGKKMRFKAKNGAIRE